MMRRYAIAILLTTALALSASDVPRHRTRARGNAARQLSISPGGAGAQGAVRRFAAGTERGNWRRKS